MIVRCTNLDERSEMSRFILTFLNLVELGVSWAAQSLRHMIIQASDERCALLTSETIRHGAQAWLATLSPKKKDAWLLRFLTQTHSPALLELRRVYRVGSGEE